MQIPTLALLIILVLFIVVALLQRGGMIESLRMIEGRGTKFALVLAIVGVFGALVYRQMFYMNETREKWITQGRGPADTISLGYNTKSRFRSLAQPLGRVMDRNGTLLAGYDLREGHMRRVYPAGPATAHIVGYWTGPLRDGVGVEKALTLVNDSLKDDLPHDVKLAIDLRLQRDALSALAGRMGAVVVMDAASGEVLAAANYPTYDPNGIWNDTLWRRWVLDTETRPLTSRVFRDNYSPGSSIKTFIAAAAHDLGSPLPEDRNFSCGGVYVPSSRIKPIGDHGSSHGHVDLKMAMRVSCNVYFSYLAYGLLGYDNAKRYFDSLYFNQRLRWNTGIFLNQSNTLLPVQSWVRARDEIAKTRLGIGQASVKTNPLHMTFMVAGIANDGAFVLPSMEAGREPDTVRAAIGPATASFMQELLREPLLPGGTAYRGFAGIETRGITVYGKTGTADKEPDGREPSWFISFAHKNGRRFAVVVAIQDRKGKYAGEINVPITRRMFEALDTYGYFRQPARKDTTSEVKRQK